MQPVTLRARLDAGETVFVAWVSTPSVFAAEALARDGWAGVVMDIQHGFSGYETMVAALAAIHRGGAAALVRVPMGDDALIGRAPDAGAQGIICPMINSGQDASWFARACKYPPDGQRSWAPGRVMALMGLTREEYLERANALTVTLAMVETRTALRNIDAICSTRGIDVVFVGTNDLCVSLTDGQAADPNHPEVVRALETIVRKCDAHGVFPGAYANTPQIARQYRDMGFRLIAVSSDDGFMLEGSRAARAILDAQE